MERVFSGAPWEQTVGYCRAVKAGGMIFVTGTAPVGIDRVGRTRLFVTDISKWEEYGRAHHEVFADHPPATTMVEVSRLIDPDMMIEVEADVVV